MGSRGIPEDLLVEILKRLSVKSLLRLKATSKRLFSIISCRNFIKSHLSLISAPDRVLILNYSRRRKFFKFPDDGDESRAVTLNKDGLEPVIDFKKLGGFASCDGIVCLFGSYLYDATPPIIPITLWNPATRKFKSLPTSSYSASIDKIGARWDVGFGFDRKTDDYKVVAIIGLWEKGAREHFMNYVEVYSLKTNSWRVLDAGAAPIFYTITPSTYTQGVCYWMPSLDNVYVLVSFDMEEEVFRVTPAPPPKLPYESTRPSIVLASSNESLVVMYYNTYSPIEVWAMKDLFTSGGDYWRLEYILEPPAGVPPVYDLCLLPLGLWKNCLLFIQSEDSLPHCTPEYAREFCLYNPGTGEIRHLQFPERIFYPSTYSYKETLVSLA